MVDQLLLLDDEHLLFLAVLALLASVVTTILTGIIAVQVRKLRERQLELGFKNDLLRRGLSVDEAVRLATSRRPTCTQSLMALGDWTLLKLARGWQHLTDSLPHLLRPCRRLLNSIRQKAAQLYGLLKRNGPIWLRTVHRHACQLCRTLWRESRPLLRWTTKTLSDCVHWFATQTDRLVRRLAPHRP